MARITASLNAGCLSSIAGGAGQVEQVFDLAVVGNHAAIVADVDQIVGVQAVLVAAARVAIGTVLEAGVAIAQFGRRW